MEATGAYWKPIYNILEGQFALLVVNAHHVKAVPGRKTDVRDVEWIADLLQHGLLRGSFVPSRRQRELRELTRYRTSLVRERVSEVNRLQKTLEGANIKLASVATDVVGASGRAILEQLVAGTADPSALAQLAKGSLKQKRGELERALTAQVGAHQRLMIREHLAHIAFLDQSIGRLSQEIGQRLRPFDETLERLQTIPGVGRRGAETVLAEVGADLAPFPTHRHLASWAGLCPGNHESAGKQRTGRTRKGNPWLRSALVEAAWSSARTKHTYLSAQYHRLAARRGGKRAALAVAHTILVTVYYMMQRELPYADLGGNYFDERDRRHVERRLVRRLERLGYAVTLETAA
jgi:transposase